MILATLVATSLVLPVAVDRSVLWAPPPEHTLTLQQKRAAIAPLVSTATECIARTVSANPRFRLANATEVNDLIVDSMPTCVDAVRSMIDAFDQAFGEGAGETFFMGAYLDELPGAVHKLVNGAR